MNRIFHLFLTAFLGIISAFTSAAHADYPRDWQINFQEPASPVMEELIKFHELLLWITGGIVLFVFCLLLYVVLRFNEKANPTPKTFSHNTMLEIIWTVIPCLILVVIAIPSFRILFYMHEMEPSEITLKVVGHQWYWEYQYPDHNIGFDSYMIKDEDLKPGQLRLLEVDNRVVLPVDTNVRVLVTAADVMHSWAVPALAIKTDSIPGRVNETWVKITKPGVYYGQCSELCGFGHGFMPIAIEAVSKEEYQSWIEKAKTRFAMTSNHAISSPLAMNVH